MASLDFETKQKFDNSEYICIIKIFTFISLIKIYKQNL